MEAESSASGSKRIRDDEETPVDWTEEEMDTLSTVGEGLLQLTDSTDDRSCSIRSARHHHHTPLENYLHQTSSTN
jgi:hypothetical protein